MSRRAGWGGTVSAAAVPATIAVCLVRAWMMRLVRAAWRRAPCFLSLASMRALPAFLSASGRFRRPVPASSRWCVSHGGTASRMS